MSGGYWAGSDVPVRCHKARPIRIIKNAGGLWRFSIIEADGRGCTERGSSVPLCVVSNSVILL